MFTGIIEELGRVKGIERKGGNADLAIEAKIIIEEAKIGDSICVNGTCLTMAGIGKGFFRADVSPETLRSTNLGELKSGSKVNLEMPMRLSDRIGGHIVSGHVDCVGIIKEKTPLGDSISFRIEAPREVLRYTILKGSIAVDGISLTVTDITEKDFGIVIIPHTAKVTTMGFKGIGDKVNIEADILGKYVERILLSNEKGKITKELLNKYGFA